MSHHGVASRGYGVVRLGGFHAGVYHKTLFMLGLTTSLRHLAKTHIRGVAINQAAWVVSWKAYRPAWEAEVISLTISKSGVRRNAGTSLDSIKVGHITNFRSTEGSSMRKKIAAFAIVW